MFGRRRQAPVPAPQVSPLTAGEVEWRDRRLELAAVLAEAYTGDASAPPTLATLDALVAGWLADDHGIDVNTLVNAVGVAFGEHVARGTGLQWVIVTDEHGSDLALHGQPGDVLVHPANAVARRVVERQAPFVAALHDELVLGVARARSGR